MDVYDILVECSFTKAVTSTGSTQYSRQPIRGAVNPVADVNTRLDVELQRRTGNTVMVELKEGSNGYIQARVMVDGIAENNGAFYDTQRTAANIGVPELINTGEGNGMTIGAPVVRISRIYAIKNKVPLSVRQTLKIYENIETPGTIYYSRQPNRAIYRLDAVLQAKSRSGEIFEIGEGLERIKDYGRGGHKNFLTSPITSTSSNNQQNQRIIPEMETAKAIIVVVGEVGVNGYGGAVLINDSSRIIFDPRQSPRSHSITGRIGEGTEIHYYFSFPQKDTIRLDHRTTGTGNRNGIHQIFLLR